MRFPSRRTLVALCVLACVANLVIVGALGGTGTLKTAEPGDVTFTKDPRDTTNVDLQTDFRIPESSPLSFAIEHPTDVDVFYNAGIGVRLGGPMYGYGYRYAPPVWGVFYLLSFAGYTAFKILWTALSALFVASGTWLLVRAERGPDEIGQKAVLALALVSVGFAPMVENLKTGQPTPFAYLGVALFWYGLRRADSAWSGGGIAIPALLKPYLASPLFVSVHQRRFRDVAGFVAAYGGLVAIAALVLGPEIVIEYGKTLVGYALTTEGQYGATAFMFADWSVNAVRPLFFLGPLAASAGKVFGVILLASSLHRGVANSAVESLTLSVIGVFVLFAQVTVIDLGMVLAPLVVLGVVNFDSGTYRFEATVFGFVCLFVHPYYMEATVGRGHPNLLNILGGSDLLGVGLALLQPATFGLLGLLVAVLWFSHSDQLGVE